jgi:hypothetical protein
MLTAFFSWGLGRELAPDDNAAAFAAVALATIAWVVLGRPGVEGLVLLGCAVGFARVTARTVGEPARVSDTVVLVVLSLALTAGLGMTAVGIGAALALALDGLLPAPRRVHLPLALVPFAAVVASWVRRGVEVSPAAPYWAIAAGVGVTLAVIVTHPPQTTACDIKKNPVVKSRVQYPVAVNQVTSVWATLTAARVADIAPLWGTLAGVVLGRLRRR